MSKLELTIHLHISKGEALFDVFRVLSKLKEAEALNYTIMSVEYVGD